jgi:hypothetical protein
MQQQLMGLGSFSPSFPIPILCTATSAAARLQAPAVAQPWLETIPRYYYFFLKKKALFTFMHESPTRLAQRRQYNNLLEG